MLYRQRERTIYPMYLVHLDLLFDRIKLSKSISNDNMRILKITLCLLKRYFFL